GCKGHRTFAVSHTSPLAFARYNAGLPIGAFFRAPLNQLCRFGPEAGIGCSVCCPLMSACEPKATFMRWPLSHGTDVKASSGWKSSLEGVGGNHGIRHTHHAQN